MIYLHGFASAPSSTKAKYFAQGCQSLKQELLIPDLNQPSFEKMTLSSQLSVIDNIIDEYLRQDELLERDRSKGLVIVGSSMGGLLAALSARRHKIIRALILMAPAFGVENRWENLFGENALESWQRNGFLDVYHYGFEKQMKLQLSFWDDLQHHSTRLINVSVPAIVFHGRNDEVVPLKESIDFSQLNQNHVELHILEDDHQLISSLPEIWEKSEKFLKKLGYFS